MERMTGRITSIAVAILVLGVCLVSLASGAGSKPEQVALQKSVRADVPARGESLEAKVPSHLSATLTEKSTLGIVPALGASKEAKTRSNQDAAPTEKSTLGIVPAQGPSKEAK